MSTISYRRNTGKSVLRAKISFAVVLLLFFFACTEESEEERIVKMEILYNFNKSDKKCTEINGKGGIKNVSPKKIINDMDKFMADRSYLSIKDSEIFMSMPWPFENIKEPLKYRDKKTETITFKGTAKIPELKFSASRIDEDISIIHINGTICYEMPTFLKENVYASCIKDIIKSLRKNY